MKYYGLNTPEYWNDRFQSGDWREKKGRIQTVEHMTDVIRFCQEKGIDLEGIRVLDMGCAEGDGSDLLRQEGAQVTGADFSESAIRSARERFPEIRFEVWDIRRIPETFDLVICCHTLEHTGAEAGPALDSLLSSAPIVICQIPLGSWQNRPDQEHIGDPWMEVAKRNPEVQKGDLVLFK